MKPLGQHVLIEMWGCNARIDEPRRVRAAMEDAVAAAGATLLHIHVHRYSPQGVTAIAVLAESHFALHSWPENDYVAADMFTCGDSTDSRAAIAVLEREFKPRRVDVQVIERGTTPEACHAADRAVAKGSPV